VQIRELKNKPDCMEEKWKRKMLFQNLLL
jgi:hypothetical protein